MNKTRFLSIVLLIAVVLATPTYAISDKASDQLFHYNVDVTTSNGKINVSANVVGSLSATKVGLENICVDVYKRQELELIIIESYGGN